MDCGLSIVCESWELCIHGLHGSELEEACLHISLSLRLEMVDYNRGDK